MAYKLSEKSLSKLEGVHPDLIKVVKRAIEITECDFTITEGLRTKERQAQLFKEKKTTTMNSRHLTGHAVDLAAWIIVDKKGTVSWDWKYYYIIEKAMKQAAKELEVPIEWGGDWKSFKDAPHWQLPFKQYPIPK
ncbi:M15 family metallopeptidase [Acinetobacter bereziniae]|uniref:M15 family metallopeptidase n=1 Tax=Acinetobacter bereziniae TaxID=106648 RepID=UPI002FDA16EB